MTSRYIDNILAPIVSPGARRAYRMGQEITLDYDNDSIGFLSQNMLVSVEFLDVLYKCTTICHKCQYHINFEEVGFGPAKTIIAKCSNKFCNYDDAFKKYHAKRGHFYFNKGVGPA